MAAKEALKLVATLGVDSDVEVDEQLWSSSENESDGEDESRHNNVLKMVQNLNKKSSKRKRNERSEPNVKVSEFHLSVGEDNDKVEIKDLIGSLQKEGQYGGLKKKLESMERNAATLDAPLHQPEADRIQRTIAFDETSKEVSKWQPIIKKNREAEHLSFPMDAYKPPAITTKTLTVTFKPRTPLEKEIAAVLKGSSHLMERKDKELTEEEEQSLLAMDLVEAKERRSELRHVRALQSYYEEKCRRTKKIKSKKYHRIKRRGELRAAIKLSTEELNDPQKADEQLEKLDRIRVEERLSLKHRSTSKWAKHLLIRGQNNKDAKRAIKEQLELSRKLTEKQKVHSDSEEEEEKEDNEESSENVEPSSTYGNLKADGDNPWGLDPNVHHETNSGPTQTKESLEFKRVQAIHAKETSKDEKMKSGDSESEEDREDDFEIKLSKKHEKERKKSRKRKPKDEETMQEAEEKKSKKEATKNRTNVKKKKRQKTKSQKDRLSHTQQNIDMKSDEEANNSCNEDSNEPSTSALEAATTNAITMETHVKDKSVIVDPNKIFQMDEYDTTKARKGDTEYNQHILSIQQAFANDDVIEEFVREKEEVVESFKGEDLDLTLPGWGDWGGPGVKVSSKKKRFIKKAEEPPPRKDKHLAHVIINEEENKPLANLQVKTIPHMYTKSNQFERSIRNPVGKHWNTGSTVKKLTRPRVQTLMGAIIEPIKPTKELKRPNTHNDSNMESKQIREKDMALAIYD